MIWAALCGALLGVAYWPHPTGWLALFFLAPFLWFSRQSVPRAAFLGWICASVAWAVGIHWMAATIAIFLKAPMWLGVLGWLGLSAAHGLMGAFMAGLPAWAARRAPAAQRSQWQALTFVLTVLVLDRFFPMAFPMRFASTLAGHLPALQIAEIFGTAGPSALIVLVNAALYLSLDSYLRKRNDFEWRWLAAAFVLLAANEQYGRTRIAQVNAQLQARAQSASEIVLLQAAIPVWQKRRAGAFAKNLEAHNTLIDAALREAPADLVIWPETTYRLLKRDAKGDLAGRRRPLTEELNRDLRAPVPMLLGSLVLSPEPRWRYNSAVLIGAGRDVLGWTAKRYRMPFGEYIPFGDWLPFLYRFSPRTTRILAGERQRLLVTREGLRLGLLICYEDMQGDYARRYGRLGAEVLVNMTNDAWFGHEMAHMHLRFAALRAIENRRPLLRAVNTGISAHIDATGKIVARLGGGIRGALRVRPVPLPVHTPYQTLGDLPYYAALVALILVLGRLGLKR
jgi:apolipoprotein N-acyltransferase